YVEVIVDCGALTAGVDANGEPGDITTSYDYTINWNSTFANSCTLERNTVDLGIESNNSSKAELAEANGDYIYDLVCTNTCSETASDSVTVTVDLCGNTICEAFEDCLTCSEDCGECPKAWWQVWGGNLFAGLTSSSAIVSDIPSDITCIEPACTPGLSVLDRASITDSDGFPVTGGGAIEANGEMVTYRDPYVYVIGSAQTRFYENYDYFYSKYSLGLSPPDDFTGSEGDAQKPIYDPDKVAYFRSGDLTIQSAWAVADGESYVVFIDGNLIIDDFSTVGELITVAEGGFLAFIVSGDINITESVGYSVLTNTAGNIEGIYIADGVLSVATNGVADKRFVGEGTFVGWEDVSILRDYDVVLGVNNESYPAETFIYRPDFMKNTPEKMKRAQMLWQETN
ncbi:hypothetical protein KKE34_03075, partial [Patescibacteria group bacterium]|nr:hypothetical protein [Patescibacteria group bacterium]